jgi:hypothetical protein
MSPQESMVRKPGILTFRNVAVERLLLPYRACHQMLMACAIYMPLTPAKNRKLTAHLQQNGFSRRCSVKVVTVAVTSIQAKDKQSNHLAIPLKVLSLKVLYKPQTSAIATKPVSLSHHETS